MILHSIFPQDDPDHLLRKFPPQIHVRCNDLFVNVSRIHISVIPNGLLISLMFVHTFEAYTGKNGSDIKS